MLKIHKRNAKTLILYQKQDIIKSQTKYIVFKQKGYVIPMKKIISALLALSILFAASSMCFAGSNMQMVGYCMVSNTCCVEFAPSAQTSQVKEQPIIEDLEFTQDGKSMDSSASGATGSSVVLVVVLIVCAVLFVRFGSSR